MKKTEPRVLRGISYGRVSTLNQVLDSSGKYRDDASPAAQKIRCQDHANFLTQKSGITYSLIEQISDEGFSAKSVNRPGYQKMWKMIESESVNFVIASELSRLSRSVTDFLDLVAHCQKHKVDLIIIGLDLDTSSPFGRVIVVILVALAQFEREMTSMRVRENAHTRLVNEGKINGGAEILGLDRDPNRAGHFVPNEEELKTVRKLMQTFLKVPGKAKLIEHARKNGIYGKRGQPLSMHAVTIMLHNAKWRYRGLWPANLENKETDPELIPANRRYQEVKLSHGPLIETELLDQVLEKLKTTYAQRKRTGYESYTYLLSGILKTEDGAPFTGQYGQKGAYRYYYNEHHRIRVRCDLIDKLVRQAVKEHFASDKRFAQMVQGSLRVIAAQRPEIDAKLKELSQALQHIEVAEKKIQSSFDLQKMDAPAYGKWLQQQIQGLAEQRSGLERELTALHEHKEKFLNEHRVAKYKNDIREYVDEGFDQQSPTVQRAVIEKVVPQVLLRKDRKLEIQLTAPVPKGTQGSDEDHGGNEDNGNDKKAQEALPRGRSSEKSDYFLSGINKVSQERHSVLLGNKVAESSILPQKDHPTSLQTRLLIGLPDESPLTSKDFLTEMYVTKGLSAAQIAKQISSSKTAVLKALRSFGIAVRTPHLPHERQSQSRYGWKRHKCQQAPYAKEQNVMGLIKELRADGLSFRQIARTLSKLGVPTKCKGRKWHPEMVRRVLA